METKKLKNDERINKILIGVQDKPKIIIDKRKNPKLALKIIIF
jgi:hypothetical protein